MAYAALGGNGYGEGGGRYPGVGVAAPQQAVAQPPVPPSQQMAPQTQPGLDPNLWYDPSKLQAAIQAQGAGKDGRTILNGQYLDSIINPNYSPDSKFLKGEDAHYGFSGSPADDNWQLLDARPDQLDIGGHVVTLNKGADGTYSYTNNYDNPSANNGSKNQAQVQFKYDPTTGKSTPVGSGSTDKYNPSGWVDNRVLAELAAVVGTAGLAGYASTIYGAGAGTGTAAGTATAEGGAGVGAGAGAGGGSAAAGNQALLESSLNTAGYGSSSAGSGLGAYSSGAGYSGLGATAANANATNPALIESASGTPGYGASSAGAGGGAGAVAGSGLGQYAKTAYDIAKSAAGGKGGQGGGGIAGMFGLGGMTPGDRYRQQLAQQALSQQAYSQTNPTQAMPGWIGGS